MFFSTRGTLNTKWFKKSILRDAVRSIVPDQILNNPRKVGFNGPIEDLLDLKNSNIREYLLDNSEVFELVDKNKVEELLKKKVYLIVKVNSYLIF